MPHMDGLAALEKMLEIKSNTKVLVISALADHHTAIESLTYGADQFICKPFTNNDLKEALDDIVEESLAEQHTIATPPSHALASESSISPTALDQVLVTSSNATPDPSHYPSGYVAPPNLTV